MLHCNKKRLTSHLQHNILMLRFAPGAFPETHDAPASAQTGAFLMAAKTATRSTKSATEAFENVTAASSEAVRENIDRGIAAMSEVSAFGKQNMEAWMASAAAAQKGMETISARSVAFSKQALENHVAASKALMTSKSVQDLVEKQSAYAKSSFEAYVAELTSLSEVVTGLTKETMQPINERFNAVGQLIQTNVAR
jgi:phasin family protein